MRDLFRWLVPAVAVAAMAFLLQTATAVAQDATPPATQPTTQPTGSVKVTVTGDDGKPAAGVTVSVAVAPDVALPAAEQEQVVERAAALLLPAAVVAAVAAPPSPPEQPTPMALFPLQYPRLRHGLHDHRLAMPTAP